MMNMDKVICIGYFVAGHKRNHKKNNDVFLHWQHREKCPEVIKTYNRSSSLAKGYDSGPTFKGDPNRNPWLAKMITDVQT